MSKVLSINRYGQNDITHSLDFKQGISQTNCFTLITPVSDFPKNLQNLFVLSPLRASKSVIRGSDGAQNLSIESQRITLFKLT